MKIRIDSYIKKNTCVMRVAELHFSYLGYQKKVIQRELTRAQRLGVKLTPSLTLQEVVVEDDPRRRAYRSYLPGKGIGIQASDIKGIPNLVGETDLFRLLQLEGDIHGRVPGRRRTQGHAGPAGGHR